MKNNSVSVTRLAAITGLMIGGFALSAWAQSVWVGPTANPPANNVPAPINVGGSTQYKTGRLGIGAGSGIGGTEKLRVFGTGILNDLTTARLQVTGGGSAPTPAIGMVLTAKDTEGTAEWQVPANTTPQIISASYSLAPIDQKTIASTGTTEKPVTVTVNGAVVGDAVVVGLPSNYYRNNADAGAQVNVCGPVTATVSQANTVQINFWNSYGSTQCTIPNGPYNIKVLK